MAKEIEIYRGYEDGDLDLSKPFKTWIRRGRKIIWRIKYTYGPDSIKVTSITLIDSKPGNTPEIFSQPPIQVGEEWHAEVSSSRSVGGKQWAYNIHWTDNTGRVRTFDPIIAVRPTSATDLFISPKTVVGVVVAAGLILSALKFFKTKRRR